MEPDSSEADLAKFLRKVLDIQLAEPGETLSEEELSRMAKKVGLSDDDWERVCQKLSHHLEAGRNFLSFENFPDAIIELDQAVAIAPYRTDVLIDCGKAHAGHWKESGGKDSRDEAERLFRKGLEIDPGNADAAEQLSDLKRANDSSGKFKSKAIWTGVSALIIAGGLSAWFTLSSPAGIEEGNAVQDESRAVDLALDYLEDSGIFRKDFPINFSNSLEMRFVSVPIFEGTDQVRTVSFSIFETRIKDYREFVEATGHGRAGGPSAVQQTEESWNPRGGDYSENDPVTYVSWHDAKAFCEWLTLKERSSGMLGPNERYRLPTDHEWSCAIGIGQVEDPDQMPKYKHNALREVYPWGTDWPPATVLGNYMGPETGKPNAGPFLPDAFDKAAPVGSFPLTHWGASDLGGNAYEWCEDHWDVEMIDEKTVRGGSFHTQNGNHLLSAGRRWIKSHERQDFIGFRVVLDRDER